MPQDGIYDRTIESPKQPADRMRLFLTNLTNEKSIRDSAQPAWAEVESLSSDQEQGDRRNECDGEHCSRSHRQVFGKRERLEEPHFLGVECEYRDEGDGDHQQRIETRRANLFGRADDDVFETAGPPFLFPTFELLVRLLDHDDRGVHHRPDGDRYPG